jgi:hypothetical protein
VERLRKDGLSMGNGGKGRIKKKEKIQGELGMMIDIAIVPRQRCQKAC